MDYLPASDLGVEPSDVTDVILTHLHFDHVGWTTQQGAIVFPNATYRCHSADWQHFIEGDTADDRAIRKLSPVAPRLELFDTDHTVATGIDVRHAPGHTPGSVIVIISSGDDRAMLIGDVHTAQQNSPKTIGKQCLTSIEILPVAREALAAELEEFNDVGRAAHFRDCNWPTAHRRGQRSWML